MGRSLALSFIEADGFPIPFQNPNSDFSVLGEFFDCRFHQLVADPLAVILRKDIEGIDLAVVC